MNRVAIAIVVVIAAVAAAVLLPTHAPPPPNGAARVVATVPPVAAVLREIVGDRLEVVCLLSPGASPHTYDPRPTDVRTAESALALFYVDANLDGWAAKLPTREKVALFAMLPEDMRLPFAEDAACAHDHGGGDDHDHAHCAHDHADHNHDDAHAHDDADSEHGHDHEHDGEHGRADEHGHEAEHEHAHHHGHDHGHVHGEFDPHFWTDPQAVKAILPQLAAKLGELDPPGADAFQQNADAFAAKLDALDKDIADQLAPLAGKPVFMFHPSLRYMVKRYGLAYGGAIEEFPGKEPSPQYLRDLTARLAAADAGAVFTEPQHPRHIAQTLADRLSIGVGLLDPLGGVEGRATYAELIRYNADELLAKLK